MIIDEPEWKEIRDWAFKQPVRNQPKSDGSIRYRRNLSRNTPIDTLKKWMKVRTPCCTCGRMMQPVQFKRGQPYINVACDFENHSRGWQCARNIKRVTPEILRLENAINGEKSKDPRQDEMF